MSSRATQTRPQIADDAQCDMPARRADVAPITPALEAAANLAGQLDAPIVFANVPQGPAGFVGAHRGGRSLSIRTSDGKAA